MKFNPKVSYILGILNAERTLEECLKGIYKQKYPLKKFEVILVDGGSSDGTLDIIKGFQRKYDNIRLLHNPKKLSEGKGMSKDMGVKAAKHDILIFLDHDNIIVESNWLENMLEPFKDKKIMATQSLLQSRPGDSLFLHYINGVGVEDPFAVPYSLVSQVVLHSQQFPLENNAYYTYTVKGNPPLFGGANGAAFRKSVFTIIGGYTRDVDIYAAMGDQFMKVAVPLHGRVYHQTSSSMALYLKKKATYYYRFIANDVSWKQYRWVPKGFRGNIKFWLMIASNLSFITPFLLSLNQAIKRREAFWLLHAPFLWYITMIYGITTLIKIKNFFRYA
ncbi:glycosyltransferase [Candidatus Pacearchaeota archaeon]|nr:glycosyltransferase [Candidatus Pacearchaeota archaeon]